MTNTTTKSAPAQTYRRPQCMDVRLVRCGHVVAHGGTVMVVTGAQGHDLCGVVVHRDGQDVIEYGEAFVPASTYVVGWMDPSDWTVEYARTAADLAVAMV